MASKNIETKVEELIKDKVNTLGYEIYDVIFEKEAKDYYLRIFIDSEKGISLEDCEKVNNEITDLLDEADYIKDPYFLEISSPGVERILRKPIHYEKQIGNKINIKLYNKAENGQKDLIGFLKKITDDYLMLEVEDNLIKIDKKNISTAKTVYDW